MRLHVRGMTDLNGTKFSPVQETTGELDLDEAKRVALDRYDDLRLRARNKEPAKSITFADVYPTWIADAMWILLGCMTDFAKLNHLTAGAVRYFSFSSD